MKKLGTMKLAMGQMLVEPGEPARNLGRACSMIERAAAARCQAIVLPECLDLGWSDVSAHELAETIPGGHNDALCEAAKAHRLIVVAGLVERQGELLHNAAVVIAEDSAIVHVHRKINELDFARQLYTPGTELGVVQTSIGVIATPICADLLPESVEIGHRLARMGAKLLLSPCAWAMPADHDNAREPYGELWRKSYSEIARTHGVTVVGVSNVGWIKSGGWAGRKCIGCSIAIGRSGDVIAQAPYGEEAEALLTVDIDGL